MTTNNYQIIELVASEGHVLTNGEIYGKTIHFKEGQHNVEDFHEITDAEYAAVLAAQEAENVPEME